MMNLKDRPKAALLSTEALTLALLSASSYIFTFSSQKAYLKSFGIDELFVSVEIDAVVKSGVWLIATVAFMFQFLHLPIALYSTLLALLVTFRFPILLLVIAIPIYSEIGVNWISVILFTVATIIASIELYLLISQVRKGKTFKEYLQDELKWEQRAMESSADGKIANLLGGNNWTLVLIFLLVPFIAGSIVGSREGEKKKDFVQVDIDDSSYLIVHQFSETFIAVGFEENGADRHILSSDFRLFQLNDITNYELSKKKFVSDSLLRREPAQKKDMETWYREDFLPLFLTSTETEDNGRPPPF